MGNKTHVNVGTIGHVDYGRSGKTLLSAAIATVLARSCKSTVVISNGEIKTGYPKPRVNKKQQHKVK